MTGNAEYRAVDGVPVKVGDVVWRADVNGVRQCKVAKHHLASWWEWWSKQIYSTERAAVVDAIETEKKALGKARAEARRATKAIERLATRLARIP